MTSIHSLDRLFRPKSVAVVGASATPGKAGYMLVEALKGFDGVVYPVNPKAGSILGLKAYPSVAEIGRPVDLVFLGIPARACPAALRDAANAGAGAALIVSGGFGETGNISLQSEIEQICQETGIRLLGPNTSGFVAPPSGLSATFLPSTLQLPAGRVAVVAQSGGINLSLSFAFAGEDIGLALAVGLGNAVDVDVAGVLEYLADDDNIDVIALHLEGVTDGRRLYHVLRAITPVKPVVVLPVGRADIGEFAQSHTGNLMGSFALTQAALKQAGAVVVSSMTNMIDAVRVFSAVRLRPKRAPGIGVLTGQAGPGLLITDLLKQGGVRVPEISANTVEMISELLPPMTYMRNPVDTGRPAENFGLVLEKLASDPDIEAVLAYALYEQGSIELGTLLANAKSGRDIPLIVGTGGLSQEIALVRDALKPHGVPVFDAPDRSAMAMRALVEDAENQWRLAKDNSLTKVRTRDSSTPMPEGVIDEAQAKEIFGHLGVGVPIGRVCSDHEAALAAFEELHKPTVAKVLNLAVLHKTEVGGVHLGLETREQFTEALQRIDDIPGGPHRYLIEESAPDGLELIVGATRDESFGPTVLVGIGGTLAEALGDVAVGLAPLSDFAAEDMLDQLRATALLDGWRGSPGVDRSALISAMRAIGDLMIAHPDIAEVEINPLRAYPDGLLALDGLIVRRPR